MKSLLAALLAGVVVGAQAQDALRGKRLYLDADRIVGSGISCVDCHGGLPGGAFGIGKAANSPDVIERAVNAIGPMAPFRARLNAQDYADLAAFIGNPGVPSPDLRVTITAPAGGASTGDRINFGAVAPGASSTIGSMQLVNLGQLPLQLLSLPRLAGSDPADFNVVATDCRAPATLQPQQACRIDLVFRPLAGSGPRSAAVQIDHDWIDGLVALALLGRAETPGVNPPATNVVNSGGGAVGIALATGLAVAAWVRRRPLRPVMGRPD